MAGKWAKIYPTLCNSLPLIRDAYSDFRHSAALSPMSTHLTLFQGGTADTQYEEETD